MQSDIKHGRYFWLASVLVFFAVIRRELNHLPELVIPSDFMLLSRSYDWWEDAVLLLVYIAALGLLVLARRYLWVMLKRVPVSLYLSVTVLAILQYMGENAIVFSQSVGVIIEEVTESIVYTLALWYLWTVKLDAVKYQLISHSNTQSVSQ